MKLLWATTLLLLFSTGCQHQPPAPTAGPPPAGMILIPAGEALLGSDDPDTDEERRPQQRRYLPAFYIDRLEVTNAEFKRFKPTHTFAKGEESLPATEVLYADAEAYAKWAGKRLPTEDEWEKAARGTDGRRFPWGNVWDKNKVAARAKRTAKTACGFYSRVRSVGSVPAGASPYGCQDMAGNAWEWVQGHPNGNPSQRILRGGAVGYGERACQTYERAIEGTGAT